MAQWIDFGCEDCGFGAVGEKSGTTHIAARFGSNDPHFYLAQPYLNGEPASLCTEAKPGSNGYVICFIKSDDAIRGAEVCGCGSGKLRRQMARGNVTVLFPAGLEDRLNELYETLTV